MTGDEILGIALEQSAIDSGCRPSDFLSPAGCIVVSRADPRARRYLELPFDCDLTCYGNGIVASVAEPLVEPVRGYIERFPAVHCFETPNLLVLAEALAPFGLRVCFMASYYLPLPDLRPLPCALNVRFLTPPDLAGLYLPQWSNALCEKRRDLDVLAAGAYDGDRLVGRLRTHVANRRRRPARIPPDGRRLGADERARGPRAGTGARPLLLLRVVQCPLRAERRPQRVPSGLGAAYGQARAVCARDE